MDPTKKLPPMPQCSLAFRSDMAHGFSPYRLMDERAKEIPEANDFLDAVCVLGLSERSLRTYGYCLLNFWKWLKEKKIDLEHLSEADLASYIRFQHRISPRGLKVAPTTINLRLSIVRSLYRYHTGWDLPSGPRVRKLCPPPYHRGPSAECGYLYPTRPRAFHFRVKAPRCAVLPLTSEEVREFLESLRTWRDVSITALMLFCGLRSREVIGLSREDLRLGEGQIRVRGKGDKDRVVPLAPQVVSTLEAYLGLERPQAKSQKLFLCLKGPQRGKAMTPAGIRSLFRHHRKRSRVSKANPHRFRHTFGADMARAGISLPALMHLMGHTSIRTTMLYVELSPNDVWDEFLRVTAKIKRNDIRPRPSTDAK